LHGGGLIYTLFGKKHAIIVELKSRYAYESLVFPIVSDGIQGIHALIDIRKYHSTMPGEQVNFHGRKPATVDSPLLNRIFNTLAQSFQISDDRKSKHDHFISKVDHKNKIPSPSRIIRVNDSSEDYILVPSPSNENHQQHTSDPVSDILGSEEGANDFCWELPLVQIQQLINSGQNTSFHVSCRDCSLFDQQGR
jgi:hypothetical protein